MAYKSSSMELTRLLYQECNATVTGGKFAEIHLACLLGNEDSMGAFTEEDFKDTDYDGKTALHIASGKGHLGIVRHCLVMGVDLNAIDEAKNTPLLLALQNEHRDVGHELLNRDDVILDMRNGSDRSPFDIVCSQGDTDFIEVILDRLKTLNPEGIPKEVFKTALEETCNAGQANVLRTLLRNGATIEQDQEMELIFSAAESGYSEILRILAMNGLIINIKDENSNTPIHKACWSSDEDFLKSLQVYEVDIDEKNADGKTVLHLATQHGQAHSVTALLKLGATVDSKDSNGKTPLHVACNSGREQVFTVLLQHGADITSTDDNGATPLHYAAEGGNLTIIRTLLRNGADVHFRDAKHSTPLQYACLKGYFYAACTLIEQGANVNAQDETGRTPLHVICERLFESPYVRRYVKFTDVPCDRTHVELTEILLQAGCDASLKDENDSLAVSVILRRLSGLPESGSSSRVLFSDEVSNALFELLLDAHYESIESPILAKLYSKVGKPVMKLLINAGCGVETYPNAALLSRLAKSNDMTSVRQLHEAGYVITEQALKQATTGLENASEFRLEALGMTREVLKLKDQCRLLLRAIFRRRPGRMTSHVEHLPIPVQLKEYLTMHTV